MSIRKNQIAELPLRYAKIWSLCLPRLKKGRPGDDIHAQETVNLILNYSGKFKLDKDILIPVAMMHDIGHSAILSEHFKYITGPNKIENGKLVHMLAGAKIAHDILEKANYDKKKSKEIVDIISIHDSDQLKNIDLKKIYNTQNKKLFHDFDALDRYTEKRIKSASFMYKDRKVLLKMLEDMISLMFFKEFKDIARKNLEILRK